MPLPAGTRLGRYEIVDLVGTEGMGEVYRARDTHLHRLDIPAASIDYGRWRDFLAHPVPAAPKVPYFEKQIDVHQCPVLDARAIALAMKTEGAAGGPPRVSQ